MGAVLCVVLAFFEGRAYAIIFSVQTHVDLLGLLIVLEHFELLAPLFLGLSH